MTPPARADRPRFRRRARLGSMAKGQESSAARSDREAKGGELGPRRAGAARARARSRAPVAGRPQGRETWARSSAVGRGDSCAKAHSPTAHDVRRWTPPVLA